MDKFKSRKLILVVATVILVVANKKLDMGLDESTMNKIIAAIGAYLVGQGIADHGNGKSNQVDVPEQKPKAKKSSGKSEPKVLMEDGK